jgi:tryptophan-rich sensory protein
MAEAETERSWWKAAIVAVIAIELLGGLSGWISNSGYGNGWFDSLQKPSFMPPGWLFGVVWPILYALLGISLAMVLAQPPSSRRTTALLLFIIQLALNLAWSPVFFAGHDIVLAKWLIVAIALISAGAAVLFFRIRSAAGLLLIPYLAWLVFAASLNWSIDTLNPSAGISLFGS